MEKIKEIYKENKRLIIFGVLIHLFTAVFSAGYYHVDEHFQILEFTSLKLGLAEEENLPWEYQAHLRPTIQPTIAYVIIKSLNTLGLDNPFFHATILRIISGCLSLVCLYLLFVALRPEIKSKFLIKWFLFLSIFIWFLPYLHVRFSSENWAGIFFWIGFTLQYLRINQEHHKYTSFFETVLIGFILGISFVLRFQIGLMIGGYLLWLLIIKKEKLSTLLVLCSGIGLFIFVGLLIDFWYYGEWTFTAWNYFKVNLIESKTSEFGIEPWWFYIEEIVVKGVPPFSVIIVISTILIWFKFPKHAVTWLTVPYIAVHSLIGHKELRFLFSLVYIVPFMIVLTFQFISEVKKYSKLTYLLKILEKPVILLFLFINLSLVFVLCFKPADMHIYLYQFVYNRYDPEKTEIVSIGRGPYSRAVPVNFYKKRDFHIETFENKNKLIEHILKSDKTILFATKKPELDSELKRLDLLPVYQNLPPGVRYYNINNWVERTPFWTLYEKSRNNN